MIARELAAWWRIRVAKRRRNSSGVNASSVRPSRKGRLRERSSYGSCSSHNCETSCPRCLSSVADRARTSMIRVYSVMSVASARTPAGESPRPGGATALAPTRQNRPESVDPGAGWPTPTSRSSRKRSHTRKAQVVAKETRSGSSGSCRREDAKEIPVELLPARTRRGLRVSGRSAQ